MEVETTVTTPNTKQQNNTDTSGLNESPPEGSWRRKEKFRKATISMLIISNHYLKAVLKSAATSVPFHPMLIEQKGIANESHFRNSGWICGKYSGTEI